MCARCFSSRRTRPFSAMICSILSTVVYCVGLRAQIATCTSRTVVGPRLKSTVSISSSASVGLGSISAIYEEVTTKMFVCQEKCPSCARAGKLKPALLLQYGHRPRGAQLFGGLRPDSSIAVEASLGQHVGQRSLEQNVVPEGAEQPVRRRRISVAAAIGFFRAGPPGQAGTHQDVVLPHPDNEEQSVIGGARIEREGKLRGETRDQTVGPRRAEQDQVGAGQIVVVDLPVALHGQRQIQPRPVARPCRGGLRVAAWSS